MKVIVYPYKSEWKLKFEELYNILWPHVCDYSESIEHIGSTSVEGLSSKDIIDLDIVILSYEVFPQIVKALANLGYTHRGDLGIFQRESFINPIAKFPHNLYVCINGSTALKNHLTLKNHLRNNPKDCSEYSKLKLSLAKKFPNDIDSYCEGKSQFILKILQKYDFDNHSLIEIETSNTIKIK